MLIGIQDELLKIESLGLLDTLLQDKTTGANIIWATDAYAQNGDAYQQDREIISGYITGVNSNIIKTRVRKELEEQSARTKQHAEVFTPMWVCKMMNDYVDETWSEERGELSEENWREYVDSRRMEITCGEAPFLVSRYDASTGEAIPIEERIGMLDRKLKVVGEYAKTDDEWFMWALRAFQATYGYEFQGDNVLIARVNLLMTYEEYFDERFGRKPDKSQYKKIADIISWNIWQMDGLSGGTPFSRTGGQQLDMLEMLNGSPQTEEKTQSYCMIYDWVNGQPIEYKKIVERSSKMKFDYIIGNPPYQEEIENNGRQRPIYNYFMDEAYKIGDVVELITPARFLSNAGLTPKSWNKKMLNDEHLKVLESYADSSIVFPNTDIMGGVVITYRDKNKKFGAIGTYTHHDELSAILERVGEKQSIMELIYGGVSYRFSDTLRDEHPECIELIGRSFDLRTNVFDNLQDMIFFDEPKNDRFVKIIGLYGKNRAEKWIDRKYIICPDNFEFYKVCVTESNGSGAIGVTIPTPLIGIPFIEEPMVGVTQTFICIGRFRTETEATACLKYVKTKFARTMLGILKVTQHNPKAVWKYVPIQDFSDKSDIDWGKTVAEIDRQLYKKYGLDDEMIDFIEKNVEEME